MEELLKFLVKNLTNDSEKITIEKDENNDTICYTLVVPEEEKGRLIGKEGKNIKAVRTIISAAAKKEGKKVYIKLV